MKLFIKHMVSLKCRLHVQSKLTQLGLLYRFDEPGIIEIFGNLDAKERLHITNELVSAGLPLLEENDRELLEKTEKVIDTMISKSDADSEDQYIEYITSQTHTEYSYISDLFIDLRGTSIPNYIVQQKIERAKELLIYTDKKVFEVAKELNYSSPSRLTYQFRKVTGLSPVFFKQLRAKRNELAHLSNRYQTTGLNSTERKDEAIHQIHGKSSVQNRRKKRA